MNIPLDSLARQCRRRTGASLFVALALLLLIASPVQAQSFLGSPADCAPALKKDLIQVTRTANQQLAYLNVVDQATYEVLKHSADASGSYYGIISGSANYKDFSDKRTALFKSVGYSSSSAQSETELKVVTSEAAYRAFSACMESLTKEKFGFFVYKTAETRDAVALQYVYNPTPGVTKPLALSGRVINGSVVGVPAGQLFPKGATVLPNGSGTVQVLRTRPKQLNTSNQLCSRRPSAPEMIVTISGPGMTASVTSAWSDSVPQSATKAEVVVTRRRKVEAAPASLSAISGWTANNNNRRCGHAPCSSDGKWQATQVDLKIVAPPGSTLRKNQR